jgi:hypothetical protein
MSTGTLQATSAVHGDSILPVNGPVAEDPDEDLQEAVNVLETTSGSSALSKLRKASLVALCVIKLRDHEKQAG